MVDFQISKVHELMNNQKNIRNMSVIAHVDHGKSTLTDQLVIKARIISKDSGGSRYMDTRVDEQERGITIKSAAISLHAQIDKDVLEKYTRKEDVNGTEFLINLIDSPGHVDFSSEVTAALRVTDGALVVVDCVDGICVQTETVVRQAMEEKIYPTLVLNKMDRPILELGYSSGELGEILRKRIEAFNAKICVLESEEFKVGSLAPERNEVSFSSGLQGWAFNLRIFASFYKDKFGGDAKDGGEEKIAKFLWSHKVMCTSGDPFDPEMKHVSVRHDRGVDLTKSPFVVYVLNPIYKVRDLCNDGKIDEIKKYLEFYKVDFKNTSLVGSGKSLFKDVMRIWLPAAGCVLEQIVLKLPSPLQSQKVRYNHLYEGPADDEVANAIKLCDGSENAPMTMYVSKMFPTKDNKFIAFGRVFSGTVFPGMKVFVQEPGYSPIKDDISNSSLIHQKSVLKTVVMMGRVHRDVSSCPAGNVIGLVGIDDCLKKTGTITNREGVYNIKSMKFSVSPVVKVSVSVKKAEDLAKFQEGLNRLAQSDPLCCVERSDKGQNTIACAGGLHLEICLKDLEDYAGVPIISDEPLVTYFEGITETIDEPRMTKSTNKHNRLYMTVSPLDKRILDNLKEVKSDKMKVLASNFREKLGINEDWIRKIWSCEPELSPENILVDMTQGISIINEIKEHLNSGFKIAIRNGPIIGETIRGCRYELRNAVLHADSIHRGSNQLLAPVIKLFSGLLLDASPILYEPIFKVEITVPNDYSSSVSAVLITKRGTADEFTPLPGGANTVIIGTLPVKESFTFDEDLKSASRGKASASLSFSHYDVLPGCLDDQNSIMFKTVEAVRKLKGMGPILTADSFFDKLQ